MRGDRRERGIGGELAFGRRSVLFEHGGELLRKHGKRLRGFAGRGLTQDRCRGLTEHASLNVERDIGEPCAFACDVNRDLVAANRIVTCDARSGRLKPTCATCAGGEPKHILVVEFVEGHGGSVGFHRDVGQGKRHNAS